MPEFVTIRHPKVDPEARVAVSAVPHWEKCGWRLVQPGEQTVADILSDVGSDAEAAQYALDREQARGDKARSTLVAQLEAIITHNKEN